MKNNPEIAVVGGGLVGLCAALALQYPDRQVHVIESSAPAGQKATGLNSRSIALSYASVQIFKSLGLWNTIREKAAPIRTIHISSQGRWGVARLHAVDYELEALGYVIESSILGSLLLDLVNQSKLITLDTEAKFESARYGNTVKLNYLMRNKKKQINANLLLIADGASSRARANLGIEHRDIDYGQSAVITNVLVSKPVGGTAYERFTPEGPLAMLPLGRDRYACVWTHDPDKSEHLMQLDDHQFAEALQQAFGYRLGYIEHVGQRYSFPLHRTESLTLVKNRCVLIGNAANTLHPVAGQSFNLALRDVASLCELFQHQSIRNLDEPSIGTLLSQYELSRKAEQVKVVRLGDGLVSLFSNELPLLNHLRAGALGLLDIIPVLKAAVALSGMGFSSGGNSMLRGQTR